MTRRHRRYAMVHPSPPSLSGASSKRCTDGSSPSSSLTFALRPPPLLLGRPWITKRVPRSEARSQARPSATSTSLPLCPRKSRVLLATRTAVRCLPLDASDARFAARVWRGALGGGDAPTTSVTSDSFTFIRRPKGRRQCERGIGGIYTRNGCVADGKSGSECESRVSKYLRRRR